MNHGINEEAQTLFEAIEGLLEDGDLEGVTKSLPLFSNKLTRDQIEEIRLALQDKLSAIARGAVPVVALGRQQDHNQAGELLVHFLKRYELEESPEGCFVDAQGDACWYFKVADECAGHSLVNFFNQPENRRKLDTLRFNVGAEVSSLKLWLLGLRDDQVNVLKFGYKSTGQLHLVEPEMFDLNS